MINAPTRYQEQSDRITALLEEHAATGMSVTAIARELGIDRKSAAKYLELMAARGDVSMERSGQKKLYRRSRRLPLAEAFNRLPDPLLILDSDLRVILANASFVATLGIHPSRNLVGAPLFDLDLQVFSEPLVWRNILRIQKADMFLDAIQVIDERTERFYHVTFAPLVSPAGGPGVMVCLRDITVIRDAEAALKHLERTMSTLFETAPCGIVVFNADGTFLNANPAALRILGFRRVDQLSAASMFPPISAPGALEELIAKGRAAEIELAIDFDRMGVEQIPCTKSGTASLDAVFTPFRRDGGGGPGEFAILFSDITEDRYTRRDLASQEIRDHS